MITHWDDVPWEARDGVVRHERRRLGRHAGCARVGLSRYRVPPGAMQMPVHEHADEEELAYVLAGGGLLWQDGAAHEVRAGDCVAFVAGRGAHTFVAGDGGMDLLVFAEGSRTNLTWLPRAERWWLGSGWLPVGSSDPGEAEAAAGQPALPAPSPRPGNVVALADVDGEWLERGRTLTRRRDLGRAAGSQATGVKHIEIAAGREGHPPHCHTAEEEVFVVLEGGGTCLVGDETHAVRPGSVVARPPGTRIAHAFAAGDDGLAFLAFGTRDPSDIAYYPRSGKVFLRSLGVAFRPEQLDYWDGET